MNSVLRPFFVKFLFWVADETMSKRMYNNDSRMHLQFEVWDHNNMELYSMVTQSKSLGFGLLSLPLLLTALSSSTSSSELELPELVDGGITLSRALERGL